MLARRPAAARAGLQGTHPPGRAGLGAEASARRARRRSRADRGLFLERTWRLHPDVCRYISESSTRGGCSPRPDARASGSTRRLAEPACAGSRSSTHGNRRHSPEEAERSRQVARSSAAAARGPRRPRAPPRLGRHHRRLALQRAGRACCATRSRRHVARRHRRQVPGAGGRRRPLLDGDLERRRHAARTSSSCFSRNRLNVAISRARCLAYLVCEPAAARDPVPARSSRCGS